MGNYVFLTSTPFPSSSNLYLISSLLPSFLPPSLSSLPALPFIPPSLFHPYPLSAYLLVDPSLEEEEVMDGRLVVGMNIHREICVLQMAGGVAILPDQVSLLFTPSSHSLPLPPSLHLPPTAPILLLCAALQLLRCSKIATVKCAEITEMIKNALTGATQRKWESESRRR